MTSILIVTNVFPPAIGGPGTFADQMAHSLTARGHKVTVVCTSPPSDVPTDVGRPFRLIRVSSHTWVLHQALTRTILTREMWLHRRVLVTGLELEAHHASLLSGKRYVLRMGGDSVWEAARNAGFTTSHPEGFDPTSDENLWLRRLSRRRESHLHRASSVIVPSEWMRALAVRWGARAEQTSVVLNGLTQDQYEATQPGRRAPGPLRVTFVGRLTNWKGVHTLLLAAQPLAGVDLRIVGEGPELPMLVELSRQMPLKAEVHFHKTMDRRALRDFLVQSHVFALPSLYEGLSNTLLEASGLGLACISSGCPGNREIIENGRNGLLVPYGDVEALRAAIVRLRDDEGERLRLASEARENSRRFDFEATVDAVEELLTGRRAVRRA